MTIITGYDFGEMVYLKHDPDKFPRMVTGITLRLDGKVQYCLTRGIEDVWCYSIEMISNDNDISGKPDLIIGTKVEKGATNENL